MNPGIKINGKYYRETLLKEELLTGKHISEYFIFQQDSAQVKETVDVSTETPSFTPPNSLDLNPVDYKVGCYSGSKCTG